MDVIERFLKYVSYDTRSDETAGTVPSTEKQKLLGAELARELAEIGLEGAHMDEYGYVYGFLPASAGREEEPTLGLIAHMDTSPDASGADVHPRILTYTGGEIVLGEGVTMHPDRFPMLSRYVGEELIVTDGTTLLGADDKAGVAEIVSACEYLLAHPELSHPRIAVGFTPDEEIGSGADHFDLAGFGAAAAYTVDGGELGEIEYENFNAASARVTVHGMNVHPGSAKGIMKNAVLMANDLISQMPAKEIPAETEGYEGFYHINSVTGEETTATVTMIIRDHDREKFEARKVFLTALIGDLNAKWGDGSFVLELRDSYYNMKEKILPHMYLIENAKAAMEGEGVTPHIIPIRGGTDGARLSYEGLPCPNLCTGGANFHGVHEFIPVKSMRTMVRVLVRLSCM